MTLRKDRPQVAVIGSGYWGKNLVRNFYNLGTIKLVVDKNPETVREMVEAHPGINGTTNLEDVWADDQIKGLVIATPAETHAKLAREALLNGKDVFVEKPLCLSSEEGAELVALAKSRKQILMVGHILWHHPALIKLKELISQGVLGKIYYLYSNRLSFGKIRTEENALWSFAPHDISMILGLVGEMPHTVQASGGNYLNPELADFAVAHFDFPGGVKGQVMVSWLHPFKEQKLVVVGQDKMAVFDDTAPWEEKLKLYPHKVEWRGRLPIAQKAEAEAIALTPVEPLRQECLAFLEAVTSRKEPHTSGEEGLRVLKILEAGQEALDTGKEVSPKGLKKCGAKNGHDYFAHETAIVDPGVKIGAGTKIWHFSHILSDSVLGENCNLGQNVVVGPKVTVGKGCKIQNNVSVYEGVTLEDDVFCGPSMVFTNIMNPRAHIKRMHELRTTIVRRGASIGANATIVCGHELGEHCFIGAGSVVIGNVPAHALMVGAPARRIGWICLCGGKLDNDLHCPGCGRKYIAQGEGLVLKSV